MADSTVKADPDTLLRDATALLRDVEWMDRDGDYSRWCPFCAAEKPVGTIGGHRGGCRLAKWLREVEEAHT